MSEYKRPDTSGIELALLRTAMEEGMTNKVLFQLTPSMFSEHSTRLLHRAIKSMAEKNVSLNEDSLALELSVAHGLGDDMAAQYVDAVYASNVATSPEHFVKHLGQMRIRQEAIDLGAWLSSTDGAAADDDTRLAKINAFVRLQSNVSQDQPVTLESTMTGLVDGTVTQKLYYPGWASLNKRWVFREGSFNIIGADSGGGKTAMMLNIAVNIARTGVHVGVISIEMIKAQMAGIILGILSGIDTQRISDNAMTDFERDQLRATMDKHKDVIARIHVMDPASIGVDQVHGLLQNMVSSYKVELLLVDYLQRFKAKNKLIQSTTDRVAYISETLTEVAKYTSIPIIALSQLARDNSISKTSRKGMQHLKHSAQLEHDAHSVTILSEPEERNPNARDRVILVDGVKNRGGRLYSEPLVLDLPSQRFYESSVTVVEPVANVPQPNDPDVETAPF